MRKEIEKISCEKCGREIQKSNYQKHFKACDGIKHKRFEKLKECPYCHLDISNIKAGNHVRWCKLNPKGRKYRTGRSAWNKGKKKENDERIQKQANSLKRSYREGKIIKPKHIKGHKHTLKTKNKLRISQKKRFKEGKHKGWVFINADINRRSYPEKWFIKNVLEKYNLYSKYTIKEKMPFGKYFFDFAFLEIKLDVEIDGYQHYSNSKSIEYDLNRDNFSNNNGWKVYRLAWAEIKNNTESVSKFLKYLKNCSNNRNYNIDEILKYLQKNKRKYGTWEEYIKNIKIQRDKKNNEKVKKLLSANIDFSKFGWVNEAAKIIDCKTQKVNKFMIRYLPDFYEKKCFKRACIMPRFERGEM